MPVKVLVGHLASMVDESWKTGCFQHTDLDVSSCWISSNDLKVVCDVCFDDKVVIKRQQHQISQKSHRSIAQR